MCVCACKCKCVKVTRRGEKIPEGCWSVGEGCGCSVEGEGGVSRRWLGQHVPEQAGAAHGGGDR